MSGSSCPHPLGVPARACAVLSATSSLQAAATDAEVLVVPLGSTEQHGPHLPLGTDTAIAVGLAERLASVAETVVVAPALSYGSSGEHQAFPGTLSIGAPALERLLVELCRSATCSWRRVLFVCAHGGNAEPLARAVRRVRGEGRDVRAWSPRFGGDAHAGHVETSIMLALHPEQVDPSLATPGETAPLATLAERLREEGVRAVSPNGVLGDPTHAAAAAGRRLLDDAAAELARFLAEWPSR